MKVLYTKTISRGIVVEIGSYYFSSKGIIEKVMWTHDASKNVFIINDDVDLLEMIAREPGQMIIWKEDFLQYQEIINLKTKQN